jgi:hypothetical protein
LTVTVLCPFAGGIEARSPGFASTVMIDYQGATLGFGKGKAAAKPGTYTATVSCMKGFLSTAFAIVKAVGDPPAPPQIVVKPKGAPQTGGGFLAG